MSFPSQSLAPVGGELYSHIYENRTTGLSRDHFWSLTIDFAPIEYEGELLQCSASVEWLRFPVRDWRQLGSTDLVEVLQSDLVESSFYVGRHDWATTKHFSLLYRSGNVFDAKLQLVVDFQGFTGDDDDPAMEVNAHAKVKYSGLVIVKDNLSPKPNSPQLAMEMAKSFVDLESYQPPVDEDSRYIFIPSH